MPVCVSLRAFIERAKSRTHGQHGEASLAVGVECGGRGDRHFDLVCCERAWTTLASLRRWWLRWQSGRGCIRRCRRRSGASRGHWQSYRGRDGRRGRKGEEMVDEVAECEETGDLEACSGES